MKQLGYVVGLMAMLMVLIGCGSPPGPAQVVEQCLRAAEAGDIEKVQGFFSKETRAVIGSKMTAGYSEGGNAITQKGGIKSIAIDEETINGDMATVVSTTTYGNGETETETYRLVKEDGEWKLTLSK